jgi:hypothetical protein
MAVSQKLFIDGVAVEPFRFDDRSWARILNALEEVSDGRTLDATLRGELEIEARIFIGLRQSRKDGRRVQAKANLVARMKVIAECTRILLKELDDPYVSRVVGHAAVRCANISDREIDRRLTVFKEQIQRAGKFCERFQKKPRRGAASRDDNRNFAWAKLARVFERCGKRATASEDRINGRTHGDFVSFVQAFMTAIPGETEPTGSQVRWWLRKYWYPAGRSDGERMAKSAR